MNTQTIHGNCLIVGTRGVLVRGEAGSGKTHLTDTLLDRTRTKGNLAVLVADDRVLLNASKGRLIASVPDTIAGKMEVRGHGLVDVTHAARASLHLVVDLVQQQDMERIPDAPVSYEVLQGVKIPVVCCPRNNTEAALRVLQWTFRYLFPGSPDYF